MVDRTGDGWLAETKDGYRVHIRLTPNSSRDDFDGATTGDGGRSHLKARVRAVPENGKANRALVALIAKRCRVPKSRIRFVSGETSRLKALAIEGRDEELKQRLLDLA